MQKSFSRLLFVLGITLVIVGCKPKLLPNSDLRETAQTKAIYEFLESYKAALQSRSVDAVMALVAADYFETSGDSDPANDYGYEGLKEKLTATFAKTKSLTVNFMLQNIEGKDTSYKVTYYFLQHALIDLPSGEQWVTASDVNRMTIRWKGCTWRDGFEIVSGL